MIVVIGFNPGFNSVDGKMISNSGRAAYWSVARFFGTNQDYLFTIAASVVQSFAAPG